MKRGLLGFWQVKRLGERGQHQGRLTDRGQRDKADAIGKRILQVGRDLDSQARLADATWPRKRHEADLVTREQSRDSLHLLLAPKQWSEIGRESSVCPREIVPRRWR